MPPKNNEVLQSWNMQKRMRTSSCLIIFSIPFKTVSQVPTKTHKYLFLPRDQPAVYSLGESTNIFITRGRGADSSSCFELLDFETEWQACARLCEGASVYTAHLFTKDQFSKKVLSCRSQRSEMVWSLLHFQVFSRTRSGRKAVTSSKHSRTESEQRPGGGG